MTPTAEPILEAFNHRPNGAPLAGYYTGIVKDIVDGQAHRFLIHFVPEEHSESGAITGVARDQRGGLLAFITDLDAAAAGDISPRWRASVLVARWMPLLRQAGADLVAANLARIAAQHRM